MWGEPDGPRIALTMFRDKIDELIRWQKCNPVQEDDGGASAKR